MKNFFTRAIEREGCAILPKEIKNEESFKKVGFKIFDFKADWYKVQLPDGWKFEAATETRTLIVDRKGRRRGHVIVIPNKKGKIESACAIINCRFSVFHLYESNTKKAILEDLATGKKFPICQCNNILLDDWSGNECVKESKKILSELYPGWDDPANWDNNPIKEIFS